MVLRNLIPIALFAVLIALGLAFLPNGMVKGFQVFGRIIVIIITIGLAAAIIQKLTPLTLIPGMNPISEGVAIVGDIAVVLAGAFPLVYVITRVFKTPLMKLGHVLGMNDIAAAGWWPPWPTTSPCSRCSTIWTGGVRSSTWPLRCPPPLCSATIWALPRALIPP